VPCVCVVRGRADLQYKNMRKDYLTAIWNVVNFRDVAKRLEDAKKA
jgi:superoxide dismutase, Fe-Mn family